VKAPVLKVLAVLSRECESPKVFVIRNAISDRSSSKRHLNCFMAPARS
jgi:hypothetical protein